MKFKNFLRKVIFVSSTLGLSARFTPGEERDVPDRFGEDCIKAGLVPVADYEETLRLERGEANAKAEEAKAEATRQEAAEAARANAMAQAAEEAEAEIAAKKRSDSAKKAAATKAANLAAKTQ